MSRELHNKIQQIAIEIVDVLEKHDLEYVHAGMALSTVLGTILGHIETDEQREAFMVAFNNTARQTADRVLAMKGTVQ